MLEQMAARKREEKTLETGAGRVWLARHAAGDVPFPLRAHQAVLDRAVEGGFFDAFDGRPGPSESIAAVRREMLDAANALLGDPLVEVHVAEETYYEEDRAPFLPGPGGRRPNRRARVRKWRTRLVAVPRGA